MATKRAPITITTEDVGVHFGTVGYVRRRGRIIHATDPRPFGFRWAATCDAREWAEAHGYQDITIDAENPSWR
jgi:hypothetical protein